MKSTTHPLKKRECCDSFAVAFSAHAKDCKRNDPAPAPAPRRRREPAVTEPPAAE